MIAWLIQKFRDRPDHALRLQRPVQRFAGYDRLKQEAAIQKMHAKHREQFADLIGEKPKATVIELRRKAGA